MDFLKLLEEREKELKRLHTQAIEQWEAWESKARFLAGALKENQRTQEEFKKQSAQQDTG